MPGPEKIATCKLYAKYLNGWVPLGLTLNEPLCPGSYVGFAKHTRCLSPTAKTYSGRDVGWVTDLTVRSAPVNHTDTPYRIHGHDLPALDVNTRQTNW